jgi:hypothetical protein
MATFSGAVDGCAPMGAGPSGRARWRKESLSDMLERRPSSAFAAGFVRREAFVRGGSKRVNVVGQS